MYREIPNDILYDSAHVVFDTNDSARLRRLRATIMNFEQFSTAELEADQKLQPMSDAPKDGTRIVILTGKRRSVVWEEGGWKDLGPASQWSKHRELDHFIVLTDQGTKKG